MIKKIREILFTKFKKKEQLPISQININRWVIGIINFLILIFILLPAFTANKNELQIGDIAPWDIRASRDFPIIDEELTEKQRKINIESVNPIFDINLEIVEKTQNKISLFFDILKNIRQTYPLDFEKQRDRKNTINKMYGSILNKELDKIKDDLYININKEMLLALLDYAYKDDGYETFLSVKKNTLLMVKEAMIKGILVDKDMFRHSAKNKIDIHYPDRGKAVVLEISEVFDEKEAKDAIKNDIMQIFSLDHEIANIIYELSLLFIKPNLTYNINKTKEKMVEVSNFVETVYTIVKKGEIIAKGGERINDIQFKKYNALIEHEKNITFTSLISRILIVLIFIAISYFYLSRQYPEFFYNNSTMFLITLIFCLSLVLQKIIYFMKFPPYFIPIAFSSMLFSVLISPRIAFYFTGITAFFVGFIMDESLASAIIFLTAGTTGIISMTRIRERISLTKATIYVSLINTFTILSLILYETPLFSLDKILNALWGIVNGVAAGSLTGILLPLLESNFNITTDIKLLELSDLNHPILKRLTLEAPGSYHHSIIVGNLAESAASAIGANSLLARVSSYYHDIGKITKPEYFAENFSGDKHDNLSSTLSTLILTSHIKDGVELALEYNLPQVIINIIKEHHGTSLIQYFYQRARREEDEDKTGEVKDYEYRYEGPKPQTKEAAIVMLADSIEAASRVLKEQNAPRVRGLIDKIINSRLNDGQFDECDITLKDITKIADVFERTLVSIYHSRIEYPQEDSNEIEKGDSHANNSEKRPE
ncbi:MAG: HDIG domain-containing protein [Candidatus Firestonebacteria bacterium]|nr:HDIG domain-containing protein [Candidatus Firestonebacteria bacterium]